MNNISSFSYVDPKAELGSNVEIGPFCYVEAGAVIGSGCKLDSHVTIKHHTTIGKNNFFGQGSVIGGDPQDRKYKGEPTYLVIGDDNVFREYVTIHRATGEGKSTTVGNHCFLMAYSHVAHDCTVGNHVIMANTAGIAGEVVVHDKAFISAAVTVHQFCRIGRNAMVGLSSKVVQDALPFCITDGNPGRARGLNLVGLKRNGFSREDISALKEAYRMLYSRVPLEEALARMAAMDSPPVSELSAFIANSKRGFAHPTR